MENNYFIQDVNIFLLSERAVEITQHILNQGLFMNVPDAVHLGGKVTCKETCFLMLELLFAFKRENLHKDEYRIQYPVK